MTITPQYIYILVGLIVLLYIFTIYNNKDVTLYERLGGIYNIAAVVDHFSDEILKNPLVGVNSKNPQLREWYENKMHLHPGLKFMRTLWVAEVSGGNYKYVPTKPGKNSLSLENAHCKLKLTSDEFDEVAGILSKTLDVFKVPSKEKNEVLSAFAAHKSEVANSKSNCPFA